MSRASSSAIRCSSAPATTTRRRQAPRPNGHRVRARARIGAGNADWIGADLETSRTSMEQGLGTELENVFPDDGGEKTAAVETPPPAYSEWSGAGTGGDGEDYNLEAFVSAEITLADHLAEQMALAISDPAGRMIGQYLIDMVDEAGYLTGDLDDGCRQARRAAQRCRARAGGPADLRSARRLRAQPHRMSRASSSRNATASIRRCGRWSSISIFWPSAILPPCAACAASTTKISPT